MTYISLPDSENSKERRLSFYLAMEEYVAIHLKQYDECFFMWRVKPTVIFGRNQLIQNEVNLEYCKKHNIDTIRRKSGGGCVYADMNNIMFSYINTGWDVTFTFCHYIDKTVKMLQSLGVNAIGSSRNDIMIDGRKVSGNAFYHLQGRNIVHGTMLYDTDMQNMVGAITPSDEKLVSKGVQSVRQRICLLKNYLQPQMNITTFIDYTRKYMCDQEYTLSNTEIQEIEKIQEEYHNNEYIFGRNPEYSIKKHTHIKGIGEFEACLVLKHNKINKINLMGDFFLVGDLNELLQQFNGVEYAKEPLNNTLKSIDLSKYIMSMTPDAMLEILI